MHISELAIRNGENVFCLRDNGVWICVKMCKLQREYLLSAVNDLTSSLKITNQTNKDFFPIQYFPNSWKNQIMSSALLISGVFGNR